MPTITVRNLPDEVYRALCVRAALHGQSTAAEIRNILETAVRPHERLRMGAALADVGRRAGLTDDDVSALQARRDRNPPEPFGLG